MEKLKTTQLSIAALTVYSNLKQDPVLQALSRLLNWLTDHCQAGLDDAVNDYADLCAMIYQSRSRGNLPDYLYRLVLLDENLFSLAAAKEATDTLPEPICEAAARDLNGLYRISRLTPDDLRAAFLARHPKQADFIHQLPNFTTADQSTAPADPWGDQIDRIAACYRKNGTGIFSEEVAFRFDGNRILPVKHRDPIRLENLKLYEAQRNKILENTLSFLHAKPCNNILLYGDRGTGKSSTVKALLNAYHPDGLRIVQIEKQHLHQLPRLIELLADHPLRFILFIDDLTFEENDDGYNALKACLEGALAKQPENTVIYATSNRRHLIKETFSAREGDEVHRADTIDDTLSLSDRFGLTVTFTLPDKAKYLEIVTQIATDRGLRFDPEALQKGAEQFALQKAGRSPRVARQYIDQIQGRAQMGLPVTELLEN